MSNASWEPQHFSIVTLDIEGFGSPTRTDPIRAGLRTTLRALLRNAVAALPTDNPIFADGDTGDGNWLIFETRLPKPRLITDFVPRLETELRHYNRTASSAARLRLRVGVHHGELIRDGSGYSEVSNRRDRLSLYYYGSLMDHLSLLAEVPNPVSFGTSLVLELRALPNWGAFVAHHLRLVGGATQRVAFGEAATDLSPSFRWSRRIPEFEPIRSVVRHHWG